MESANYNQNNNNIVNSSGMASLKDSINKIDLAAGGINMLAINNNGEKQLVSGTSVSSAVVAGVCAMILQWGVVEGNDPLMYSKKIKAYLARGVSKRAGDIYPNVEWGYGMLNVAELFRNMY
ncbi:S8 family serine peptidase [Clostridium sp.]|uniref:S8 family serine peptidase n=1 Tax=Clostridium sp. TaxID=1506 RepID=UPI003F3C0F09